MHQCSLIRESRTTSLLERTLPPEPEWAGWRTLTEANGRLQELGLPKVEQRTGGVPVRCRPLATGGLFIRTQGIQTEICISHPIGFGARYCTHRCDCLRFSLIAINPYVHLGLHVDEIDGHHLFLPKGAV